MISNRCLDFANTLALVEMRPCNFVNILCRRYDGTLELGKLMKSNSKAITSSCVHYRLLFSVKTIIVEHVSGNWLCKRMLKEEPV